MAWKVQLTLDCWGGKTKEKNKGVKMNTNSKMSLATLTAFGISAFSTLAVTVTPTDVTLTLPLNSSSMLVNDIQANALHDFGPGLSPAAQLNWLQQDVAQYDLNFGQTLVPPPAQMGTGEETDGSVAVMAGDYLVLHYGSGPGGSPSGGIVGLFFDTSGTYDIPQNGSGPNGFGGISFATLFVGSSEEIPDGGSTAVLLGSSLLAIGLMKQSRFSRKA
jgi:hypothetical protein